MKQKKMMFIYPLVIIGFVLFLTQSCKKDDVNSKLTDADGNVYNTVIIGTQEWMTENLKTTKYRNGDPIPNKTLDTEWQGLATGAYCDYDNLPVNSATYGKLYNAYAVLDSRNLCPAGWHVPTDVEWQALSTFLGGVSLSGGKLKEMGTTHWLSPNTGATNEHGFTALPGGTRSVDGVFFSMTDFGGWWTSTEGDITHAYYHDMAYDDSYDDRNSGLRNVGFSVRCLKD